VEGLKAMQQVIITNEAQRKAAFERSQELMGRTHNSNEERELEAIADAIEAYDVEHAVVSGMTETEQPK
jgi:hypothetical protein